MRIVHKKLALAASATLLSFLMTEAAARWFEHVAEKSKVQYLTAYDPDLGWSKRPSSSVENQTAEFHVVETTNSHGLRGPEMDYDKPPGVYRVLLLGDSFLEGYTVPFEDLVSEQLRQRLEEHLGSPVEVINGGTVGYSTDQELLFYERQGRRYSPDATVLLFFGNDIWFNRSEHYWRGAKPRFVLEGDALVLTNSPVPPPNPNEFAYAVPGGRGLIRRTRQADAWLGVHSAVYRLARTAAVESSVTRRWLIAAGLADVPGEWKPWMTEPTPEVEEAWTVTEALLDRLRDDVEADGSAFSIFYIPSRASIYEEHWEETKYAYAMEDKEWDPAEDAGALGSICRRNTFT